VNKFISAAIDYLLVTFVVAAGAPVVGQGDKGEYGACWRCAAGLNPACIRESGSIEKPERRHPA
jgi:hypothetical protein